jgi:hypothetical protein
MKSDQPQGVTTVSVRIPANYADAIFQIANERTTRTDKVTQSDLIRRFIADGLKDEIERSDDITGEIKDLLDDDLIVNSGGDDQEVEA